MRKPSLNCMLIAGGANRGVYLDSFLDGDVVADRMTEWTGRLSRPVPDRYTVVADLDGTVAGFAHTILDADPTWGAYLDNLHVRHDLKRQGIGARLMTETVRAVARRRPSTGLYLWVLEQNTAAQAFYGAQGGSCVQRELTGPFPGGGYASRSGMRGPISPNWLSTTDRAALNRMSPSPARPTTTSKLFPADAPAATPVPQRATVPAAETIFKAPQIRAWRCLLRTLACRTGVPVTAAVVPGVHPSGGYRTGPISASASSA